uniref:Uncharacterized protein n=1 Tax=Arundo donax TaxID=35708 RepID=A0A0A8ZGU4_ARUDO
MTCLPYLLGSVVRFAAWFVVGYVPFVSPLLVTIISYLCTPVGLVNC